MSLGQTLTIGTATYRYLDLGKYIDAASTADQPKYFEVESTVKPDSVSSYLLRFKQYKNSAVPGAPDDLLQIHMVLKGSTKAFTQAEFEAGKDVILTFANTANMTMIMRGER